LGFLERYAVFAAVARGLGRIPFKFHSLHSAA
jgi:hypothetical protein